MYVNRIVFCTFEFEALHCWADAPEEVSFLRTPHRHIFKVRCESSVTHDDRDIEFIMLKHKLLSYCRNRYENKYNLEGTSCEMIAGHILTAFPEVHSVEVSEDGENGARVWRVNYEIR